MSKIYQSERANNRYEETDLGVAYDPQKGVSSESQARQWGDAVVQDGETKRRELDREIAAQDLTLKLTQNAESKALTNQLEAASAELEMQQKYDTNSLKLEHDAESRRMNLALQEQKAQADVAATNLSVADSAIQGILSFGSAALEYGQTIRKENDKQAEYEAEQASTWEYDGVDEPSNPSADISNAQTDITTESAIGKSTQDPQVQNAIRQDVTQPRIQHENVRRGTAYSAAQDFAPFFNSWVNDPNLVYTRADGSKFTAATIRTRSDAAQVSGAAKRAFYKAAGIAGMPREQVRSVLNPIARSISAGWVESTGNKVLAANKAEAVRSAKVDAISGLTNGTELPVVFQNLVSQLYASGAYDFDKGKATEDAVTEILNWAIRNKQENVINSLEGVHKIYDKNGTPRKGTQLGRQYEALFKEARRKLISGEIQDLSDQAKVATAKVNSVIRERTMALAKAETPQEEQAINLAAAAQLRELNTPESILKADEIESKKNYSPFTFLQMKEAQVDGATYSNDELEALVDSSDLTSDQAKELGYDPDAEDSVDDARRKTITKYKTELKAQGTAAVIGALSRVPTGGKALDADAKKFILQGEGVGRVADIADRIGRLLDRELQINPDMDDASIRKFIETRGKAIAQEVTYDIDGGLQYEFGGKEEANVFVVHRPTDPSQKALDMRHMPPDKLYYMPKGELDDNAILTGKELNIGQATYATDGTYPTWLEEKAKALGTNPETLIRSQSAFYGVDMPPPPEPATSSPYLTPKATGQEVSLGSNSVGDLAQYDTGTVIGGINLDRLRNSVLNKESTYNFSAVNPHSGALGIGQVMPANVPSWSREALGYEISQRQFLRDPEKQMIIINSRFKKMMQQQAAAGFAGDTLIRRVASTWYSGQPGLYNKATPEYSAGHRYPSISSYTMSIVGRYRGS